MRRNHILLGLSTLATFSILMTAAAQVRAADNEHVDTWYSTDVGPEYNGIFYDGDDATCTEDVVPYGCTTAGDTADFDYNGNFNWGSSAAISLVSETISQGDYAYSVVNLLCDDGQGNQWWYGMSCGGAPDYEPPNYCWASCPDHQTAVQIVFGYGVLSKTAS